MNAHGMCSYNVEDGLQSIGTAVGIFLGVYLIVYQRWQRICLFENAWGQRDIVYDVYVRGEAALV